MNSDIFTVSLVSLWMGFAAALQVKTQLGHDQSKFSLGRRFLLARFIYFFVGIAGMLGIASLIGDFQAFKGAAFTLSFCLGIMAFLVANKLRNTKSADDSQC